VVRNLGRKIKQEIKIWRVGALPGLFTIGVVIAARLTGSLQSLELATLDRFLRLRPPESIDSRILIVGVTEKDIQSINHYPIPDKELALVLKKLQANKPSVIGLDIFRDIPIEPGHKKLTQVLQNNQNIIGIEKVLPYSNSITIDAPSGLPSDRVGFVDTLLDTDGYVRRSLLGAADPKGEYKFSFSIRVAETYLATQKIALENGIRDLDAMRFDSTELTRFFPNSGGYIRSDAGGNQILINYRSGENPFEIVSLNDVKNDKVKPDLIRGRIVLIGIVAGSTKDYINSSVVDGINPGLVYGVELQAHAISQIVSAVLNERSLLKVWSDNWEYLWIFGWGFMGVGLSRLIQCPWKTFLGLIILNASLIGVAYLLLLGGWWVPVVPALLALSLNSAGLTASLFYRRQQNLQFRLQNRQLAIEQTFNAIHNGPLQTLTKVMRHAQEQILVTNLLLSELQTLNREIREVYENAQQEALTQGSLLYLHNHLAIDLNAPLCEIFYEIYSNTTARDFPGFKTLKLKVTKFEKIDERFLNLEQKQALCRFLEECLCNAGKYALNMTRLEVKCFQENSRNIIRVRDNGVCLKSIKSKNCNDNFFEYQGRGTQQAKKLARQLGGNFKRVRCSTQGTICELCWPITRTWFWLF
jgi:CHASE2 domain-containing sensor protein/two-component sensor histidine kinase